MLLWILNNWLLLIGIALPIVIGFLVWLPRPLARYSLDSKYSLDLRVGRDIWIVKDRQQDKPEWYEVLKEEIDRLPIGKVVFNPPDTMKLGVKERIETRIAKDVNADLVTSLKGRGLPQIEDLTISELMKVRLSGEDFDIVSLNEEEQIITPTGFTEWAWDVIPKKSGKKTLHLHVTLRIRLPFGEERKDHPVLDREIVVQVNPVYSVQLFTITYWKWIVTALILPLIGWIWKTYIE